MEELSQKIAELIETLNKNSVPIGLTIFCMIVPIVISLAVAIFAVVQHYQNKRLQKNISEKELKVQMHGDILNIYDGYCLVQNSLGKVSNGVVPVFINPNVLIQWVNDMQNSAGVLSQSYNRADLLLPKTEMELRNILKNILEKFREIVVDIFDYINSGIAEMNRVQAWQKITMSYGIQQNDYATLYTNKNAAADLEKLYINDDTKRIDNKIKETMDLFEYDKFDKFFEPYLRMYTEKE